MTAHGSSAPPSGRGPQSYVDYVGFPDDGQRYELIDGEVFVSPAPNPDHQRVTRRLSMALQVWVEAHPGAELFWAPIDLILADDSVLQPDLLVVLDSAAVTQRGIERPPALAIEVLSPSTRARDRGLKRERYARAGVADYWTVDPQSRAIGRHELSDGRLELREELGESAELVSSSLSGFAIAVRAAFHDR